MVFAKLIFHADDLGMNTNLIRLLKKLMNLV